MKAIAQEEFGSPDILELKDIEKPIPGNDQVLVRIRAASPNPWDWHFMRGMPLIARPQAGGVSPRTRCCAATSPARSRPSART